MWKIESGEGRRCLWWLQEQERIEAVAVVAYVCPKHETGYGQNGERVESLRPSDWGLSSLLSTHGDNMTILPLD